MLIRRVTTGYLIIGKHGECYQKFNLADAIDFCKTLGFKPVMEVAA